MMGTEHVAMIEIVLGSIIRFIIRKNRRNTITLWDRPD